ncbi:glutathione S-transferase family protein [Parvibaculum sp.]|uniref:glutathione S-transferase family protein n=1 Tax=Parvibaculum sp. TaxID=2024848 RepID=UPI0034A07883
MNDTRRPKPAKAVAKRSSVRRSPAFTRDEANLIGFYRLDGGKISVMLEECKPPYAVRPVNIGVGDPFKRSVVKIAEDNRMPAIVDPDGPGGKPISIFESGAILRYPSRKTGIFCPVGERRRIEVDQWLFWQMAGLGSITSQAHHFSQYQYMCEKTPHAIIRHADEVNRAPRRDQQASEGPSPCRPSPDCGRDLPAPDRTSEEPEPAVRRYFIPEGRVRTGLRPIVRPEGVCPGRDWRRGFIGDMTKEAGQLRSDPVRATHTMS